MHALAGKHHTNTSQHRARPQVWDDLEGLFPSRVRLLDRLQVALDTAEGERRGQVRMPWHRRCNMTLFQVV